MTGSGSIQHMAHRDPSLIVNSGRAGSLGSNNYVAEEIKKASRIAFREPLLVRSVEETDQHLEHGSAMKLEDPCPREGSVNLWVSDTTDGHIIDSSHRCANQSGLHGCFNP